MGHSVEFWVSCSVWECTECNIHLPLKALIAWGCFLLVIIKGQHTEKIVCLFHKRYGLKLYKVICIHSHQHIWAENHSPVDATRLLFLTLKEWLPETFMHGGMLWFLCCGYWLKASMVISIWVTWWYMCCCPDWAQSGQNKHRSISFELWGLLHENITLAYFVFLEELSSGLFSVIGLFGNSDLLSLLAGFSNRKRRTYPATSTLRTPNIGRKSLLITEFRQTYLQWWPPRNLELGPYWIHLLQKGLILRISHLVSKISLFWDPNCCHLCSKCGLNLATGAKKNQSHNDFE